MGKAKSDVVDHLGLLERMERTVIAAGKEEGLVDWEVMGRVGVMGRMGRMG